MPPKPFVPIETPRITRSAALRSRGDAAARLPMGINCICGHNFLNSSDSLMFCEKCCFWSHRKCVGIIGKSSMEILQMHFVCPFCTGEAFKRKRDGDGNKTVNKIKLEEVRDKVPQASIAALIRSTLTVLTEELDKHHIHLEFVPPLVSSSMLPDYPDMSEDATTQSSTGASKSTPANNTGAPRKRFSELLTDSMIQECLGCCESAIANATFSESYPDYCLRELQTFPQKYLQGTFARCTKTNKIVAFVLSNGMDEYGNLKTTVTQLKQLYGKSPNPSPFMEECLKITDVNDFVHITLIATHESHRGRGLAKKLMLADSLRWLIRGRTRAYLNMALERLKVPSQKRPAVVAPPSSSVGKRRASVIKVKEEEAADVSKEAESDVICVASEASLRLYTSLGFADVCPSKVDPETNEIKWTPKEEEGGKVMANLDMKASARAVSRQVLGDSAPLYSGRKVLRLKK